MVKLVDTKASPDPNILRTQINSLSIRQICCRLFFHYTNIECIENGISDGYRKSMKQYTTNTLNSVVNNVISGYSLLSIHNHIVL